MNASEINRRLAEALGFEIISGNGWITNPDPVDRERVSFVPFSPATDANHLRAYVYPEIIRRGRWRLFARALGFLRTASTAVLAECALKVLEEGK